MNQGKKPVIQGNILETLIACKGHYLTPLNSEGARRGPLVGYAGKYDRGDGKELNYVGEEFFNFAMMEQYPTIMGHYAYELIADLVRHLNNTNNLLALEENPAFVGAPFGGIAVARDLTLAHNKRCCMFGQAPSNARAIYAEKKVIEQGAGGQRAKTMLGFDRHTIFPNDSAFICEDVVNNLSTTKETTQIIEEQGAKVVAILCMFNRSEKTCYELPDGRKLPIISVIHKPTAQYRQDDPLVAADVEAGNVFWQPKARWAELLKTL